MIKPWKWPKKIREAKFWYRVYKSIKDVYDDIPEEWTDALEDELKEQAEKIIEKYRNKEEGDE